MLKGFGGPAGLGCDPAGAGSCDPTGCPWLGLGVASPEGLGREAGSAAPRAAAGGGEAAAAARGGALGGGRLAGSARARFCSCFHDTVLLPPTRSAFSTGMLLPAPPPAGPNFWAQKFGPKKKLGRFLGSWAGLHMEGAAESEFFFSFGERGNASRLAPQNRAGRPAPTRKEQKPVSETGTPKRAGLKAGRRCVSGG